MKKVVLFGNQAIARTTYYDLCAYSEYEVAGFTVDQDYICTDTLLGLSVVPFEDIADVFPPSDYVMMIAIGYVGVNKLRAERYDQAKALGYQFVNFISPKTVENHRSNILKKLKLHSTYELIRYAAKLGLIDTDLWKN